MTGVMLFRSQLYSNHNVYMLYRTKKYCYIDQFQLSGNLYVPKFSTL
jgi:hypothetical protein